MMQRTEAETARPANSPRAVAVALLALVSAVLLSALLTALHSSSVVTDRFAIESLSYLVFWAPLVIAIVIVGRTGAAIPFRFRWIDGLWGLSVGLLARAISTGIDLTVYGTTGSSYLGSPADNSAGAIVFFALTAFIAPLVLGPVIEEMFFRGTVLGALRGDTATSKSIAVVISSLVFALMHVLGTSTAASALTIGLSTFLFALGAGALAVTTNRLGGAITAHVVFNGSVIALALAA
ncbi:CPBP family intramembrane metalloprotease [Salinibacterium sp. G-O1]|uniref:CPBP family intramembrane glutamic endopeptidase n=1 Tax=Salinibacterium sp. G-O1 TaxID=3046208 RepID=UPI0024B93131|nr:CPBP family intramembrane glutamic endopeptidase [Salinibacterium sp. G-O1]MDJ0336166.1 CPBP family intramembrane metalloprotease [Salinibacterium sp. G-O1]